ncbi:MAG: hypothetical protein QXT35_02200 [Conexivisphaerales archaeon]
MKGTEGIIVSSVKIYNKEAVGQNTISIKDKMQEYLMQYGITYKSRHNSAHSGVRQFKGY